MFQIKEWPVAVIAPNVIGPAHATAQDAIDYVSRYIGTIIDFEEDADHPGHYDLFVSPGRVLAIEPDPEAV